MIMVAAPRTCRRTAVARDPRCDLAGAVLAHAVRQHRAPLRGQAYFAHAAACGHVVAIDEACERFFMFQDSERDRALVRDNLGDFGRALPEKDLR